MRNQRTVNVEVFHAHAGGWILQIEDGRGNSSIWTYPFATEQEAIDAAVTGVDTEGIETFIGPDSEMRLLFDA